jgi:hypothetical protein
LAEINAVIVNELRRLDKRGVLKDGEVLVELEYVVVNGNPGTLVVTDRQVILSRTSLFLRKAHVRAVPLLEIASVEASSPGILGKDTGLLKLYRATGETREGIDVHLVDAGQSRAEEIRRSILYQRKFLVAGGVRPATKEAKEESPEDDEMALRVSLGRGVVSYVNAHGGKLYVWGEPLGADLDSVRANTKPPADFDFVRSDTATGFELYVERGFSSPRGIHLTRRWWGLRDGISVDTGLVLGT